VLVQYMHVHSLSHTPDGWNAVRRFCTALLLIGTVVCAQQKHQSFQGPLPANEEEGVQHLHPQLQELPLFERSIPDSLIDAAPIAAAAVENGTARDNDGSIESCLAHGSYVRVNGTVRPSNSCCYFQTKQKSEATHSSNAPETAQ
jgi:hypothetical protein